jgi:hypothetical protein
MGYSGASRLAPEKGEVGSPTRRLDSPSRRCANLVILYSTQRSLESASLSF